MTRYAVTATLAATNDLDPLVDAINKHAANTGITAKLGATAAEIILTHQTGENRHLYKYYGWWSFIWYIQTRCFR